ncbi:patatin-like phospholipase family protein [Shewanella sp. SR44-3]|uniref:patatin-like phospholipase family protein n=1 Tax=Shewanella sp. SR44-3 TaxID=2760936 RepID=UPI0015F9E8C1|nr:patatin-like phospholipase family protein [Shewanella sp. SR44-3]MBB1269325.1 patatin-like phospholipase family protein [Shewanella sp. SR44-3]
MSWRFPLVIVSCIFSSVLFAKERPTVGLVLSGGGAKGAAHIGVLKVLEANNIPVDYIAGTSIGAYVAGMYALGYSASEIEAIMLSSDWSKGFSDTIPREQLSYRDKQQRDQFNIPISLGYSQGQLKGPTGLLQGQTMSQLLQYSTDLVEQFGDFDELAIPYRAVATDLVTSEAVVLSSGSIVQAMQASATVPGALQPAKINGRLLIDGGIANNMPVDVVKAMGADIIIAVDIGSPLARHEQLDSTIAVLEQLSNFLTNASSARQKALLTDNDIIIRPAIDSLSTTDFSIMGLAMSLGEQAATFQVTTLSRLSVTDAEFTTYQNNKKRKSHKWLNQIHRPLTAVKFDNQSKVSESLLKEKFDLKPGDVVTKETLDAALKRVYSLNKFERVDAEFDDTKAGRVLTLKTKAKSWGPNYLQAGFNWEDDFTLDSVVAISLAYTMTDLTDNDGEWRNELELGYKQLVATEFYQPLDRDQKFYSRNRYQYESRKNDIYDDQGRNLKFEKDASRFDFGIGYNYSDAGVVELGIVAETGELTNDAISMRNLDYSSVGGYFKLTYDTLNSISFPTEGNRFSLNAYLRDEDFKGIDLTNNGDLNWQIEADWKGALKLGHHAIVGKMALATVENDGNYTLQLSELGGFLNLSGFHKHALVGAHKVFGAFIYQYDLGRDVLITDLPLYIGMSLEGGNAWYDRELVDLDDLIYSGSLYLGTDTTWGPAALGFGLSDNGEKAFYLFIGKNF